MNDPTRIINVIISYDSAITVNLRSRTIDDLVTLVWPLTKTPTIF